MPGIDYSKWDKFCDSEESDGSEDGESRKPRVTRLQYPSRVTVGPDGVHMDSSLPTRATASPFVGGNSATAVQDAASSFSSAALGAASHETPASSSSAAQGHHHGNGEDGDEEEDVLMYNSLTRNGGREGDSHLWSQTRDTASVSFILPTMQTKAKDICNFRLSMEEQPDHSFAPVITFGVRGTEGERRSVLRYPVKVNDEVVEGCWQLHSLPTMSLRLMVVQLVKEPLGVGMSLWWERCFVTDQTTVNTTNISDRSDAMAAQAEKFKRVWEQAHEQFTKQMKERRDQKLVIVNDDDDDDADGDDAIVDH